MRPLPEGTLKERVQKAVEERRNAPLWYQKMHGMVPRVPKAFKGGEGCHPFVTRAEFDSISNWLRRVSYVCALFGMLGTQLICQPLILVSSRCSVVFVLSLSNSLILLLFSSSLFSLTLTRISCTAFLIPGVFFMVLGKEAPSASSACRSAQYFTTIILIVCLWIFYIQQRRLEQMNRAYIGEMLLWPWDLTAWFLLEVGICCIHEYPSMDWIPDISLPLIEQNQGGLLRRQKGIPFPTGPIYLTNPHGLFMFLRFYLIARVIWARKYSNSARIVGIWVRFNCF